MAAVATVVVDTVVAATAVAVVVTTETIDSSSHTNYYNPFFTEGIFFVPKYQVKRHTENIGVSDNAAFTQMRSIVPVKLLGNASKAFLFHG
jgi:hypothetical protein